MIKSILYDTTFSTGNILLCLGVALVLGAVIAKVYQMTAGGSFQFLATLTVLPVLVAAVILIVNGNIGTSVAVLGAFGLVRFRSAPGDAGEIVSIFFSMAAGLAAGTGYLTLGAVLTVFVSVVMIVMANWHKNALSTQVWQLKITVPEQLNFYHTFEDLMEKYTKENKILKMKTTNMGTMYEITYRIIMKIEGDQKLFMDEIRERNGNLTVMIGEMPMDKGNL